MVFDKVSPLNPVDEQEWIDLTEEHLASEIVNTLGYSKVDVTVKLLSQDPPYEQITRLLSEGLELVFIADYSIETPNEVALNAQSFTMAAFNSDYKRTLYLDSLAATGSTAFQNAEAVSVSVDDGFESATDSSMADDNKDASSSNASPNDGSWFDSIGTGIIIGVAVAGVVIIVLCIAVFARCRKQRSSKLIKEAMQQAEQKNDDSKSPKENKEVAKLERSSSKTDEMEPVESENSKMSTQEDTISESYRKHVAETNDNHTTAHPEMEEDSDVECVTNWWFFNYLANKAPEYSESEFSDATTTNTKEPDATATEAAKNDEEFTVQVPAGSKLGMLLNTYKSGYPVVQELKPSCPFSDKVQVGDKLMWVDGDDMAMANRKEVLSALSSKSAKGPIRTLLFMRPSRHQEKKKWW